jgi:hypothetical protein
MENNVCLICGYEKPPEEWNYKICSDCREDLETEEDWFR